MKIKNIFYLSLFVVLSSCRGIKYCENQQYDFLNSEFQPCKAESATYKQTVIKAEGIPMNHRGKLISAAECGAAAQPQSGLTVPDGVYDDFKTGARRVYENGKILLEILPSKKDRKSLVVLNDYSNVSDATPFFRSWFFDDLTGEVIKMRVSYLGKASGAHEDFVKGMLSFETFNSYAGGVKREVRIAFDHAQSLAEYFTKHTSESASWLSSEKAKLLKKSEKKAVKLKKKANKESEKAQKQLKKEEDKIKK